MQITDAYPKGQASFNMCATPSADRLRAAKADAYRALILDAAEREFGLRGFDGAHMREIARAASISLATLYTTFTTKPDLLSAVHERRLGQLYSELAARPPQPDDPVGQLLTAMEVYAGFHMRHPDWLAMHLREGNAWSGDDQLRTAVQARAWQRGLSDMARSLREAMAAALFVQDDPLLIARTSNAMLQVALARWVEEGASEPPELVVRAMQRRFLRAFADPVRYRALLAQHQLTEG